MVPSSTWGRNVSWRGELVVSETSYEDYVREITNNNSTALLKWTTAVADAEKRKGGCQSIEHEARASS